jgi:hypothetical protein
MGRKAKDWIPENIRQSAYQAGLNPNGALWYVGRTAVPKDYVRQKTLHDLALEGRAEAARIADEALSTEVELNLNDESQH